MALITSAQSGDFSDTATWTGGVVPTVGDEARASTGHTITIDVNTTCDEISNAGTGKFVLSDGVTLTANVTNKAANAGNCLEFSASSPATANVVGSCTGNTSNGSAVNNLGTGTINITGDCTAGNGTFGSSFVNAARNTSTGVINITGNCFGGSSNGSQAAFNNSTGTINITGNCQGGTGSVSFGALNNSTGTLSIIGTVTASQTAAGVAGANVQQVTILSGPFVTETTRSVNPVYCAAWRWNASPSNSTYLEVMTNDLLTKRSLVTEDNVTGMPAEADVKDGVVYGPTSALTGTFSQTLSPSVTDIANAVWGAAARTITGGTVDTLTNAPASVTPTDIWSHASRTLTSASGPTAVQIRQEMDTNSTQLSGIKSKTDNLPSDPADQSLLEAAIAAVTAPSASTVASAVRSELSSELAKVSALNTERLANVATTAIVGHLISQANS